MFEALRRTDCTRVAPSMQGEADLYRRSRLARAALLATLLLGPAVAFAGAAPTQAAGSFVGSQRCASCHPAETGAWKGSQHRLAMREATAETLPKTFDPALPAGTDVALEPDGGRFVVRSTPPDRCGGAVLRYTFGLSPLQQYLAECEDGRFQTLPLAWDTRVPGPDGTRWFSPYGSTPIVRGDRLHWKGRFQNANSRCIDCHTTGFEKNYRPERDGYDSRWTEPGVGCEACHGPQSAHVERATAAATAAASAPAAPEATPAAPTPAASAAKGTFTIPGWTRDAAERTAHRIGPRPPDTEVEVCAQCHSLREPLTNGPPTAGRLFDAYLPAVLDDHYEVDGQDKEEVYIYGSFLQSRMHQKGVTCSDCHDPHAGTLRASGNALCTGCHSSEVFDTREHHAHEAGSTGAACVACHMPTHTFMGIDGRRDHSLRVPRPDLSVRYGVPNACTTCHAGRSADWAAEEVRKRLGQTPSQPGRTAVHDDRFVAAMDAARRGAPDAEALLVAIAADPGGIAIQRASALAALRAVTSGATVDAIRRALADPSPLVRAYAARSLQPLAPSLRWTLAEGRMDDPTLAVRVEVARVLAPLRETLSRPESRQRLDRLLDEYRGSLVANSDQPEAGVNLGLLEAYRGDLAAAERAYRQALRVDPRSVLALVNLADLRRLQGRDVEGGDLLRQALGVAPEDAGVHHALGLFLQRSGKSAEAVAEIARAAGLAPEVAGYWYTWAIALRSGGQDEAAIKVLEDALVRHPRDGALLGLRASLRDGRRGSVGPGLSSGPRQEPEPASPAAPK